jgi:hypothetical protein
VSPQLRVDGLRRQISKCTPSLRIYQFEKLTWGRKPGVVSRCQLGEPKAHCSPAFAFFIHCLSSKVLTNHFRPMVNHLAFAIG